MDQGVVFVTIIGMAIVTAAPRVLPLWLLSARSLPPLVVAWLRYVPPAVLAALLVPMLVVQEGRVVLVAGNNYLWAAAVAALTAWKGRNLIGTVLVGMACVALARYLGVG